MTSVEKRRSSRKSGGHRKHSDGGFSDASSGGSFPDETDREVSNLTDRAFRSLCIGEEAVYNDSDLSLSSPSIQRDRQLAFSQGRDIEERDREERKRAVCENFSLRVQQYEQDWLLGGMYGAEIQGDSQWQVYGERTQGMVSATFQHSLVETSQQGKCLREGELSFFSNGATELSSQQRRSHSRVSSLVHAFNSEGHTDGARVDNNLREWSDGTSWDRSALMSIQRELSEFSTSYQQNFDSHHFPSASLFSPQDTSFYSPHGGAMAQMSHQSSYMRSSQVKHNMSAQLSCNSNFFIHSEFSPFKLWRDHNRFPFQQGDISGFMQRSEFPKWYETPMYNELSLENQSRGPYMDLRHPINNLGLTAPPTRSTSTSTMLQKASAMEKRCESELAGHYPHRKWTESLGTNKLPSQRPSTASPTTEMSRRVRDTISSVKALQQKIKMMSEQNMTTDGMVNPMNQGVGIYGNENWINRGNNAVTLGPNVSTTPSIYAHRETEMLQFQQHGVSPQPVEHPPVRAESRGATPDIRTSSYKSRATSLLFNLKDNRKRVKSTYSPTKFQEKNKQPLMQEPCEPVMNIHGFTDSDTQLLQEPRRTAVNQYNSPGLSLTAQNCQSERVNINQHPEVMAGDYQTAQTQGQMVHQMGFSGFIPENYTNNQLANGQNPHENLASFTPCKQDCPGSMEQLQQSYSATDTARLNPENSQSREYLISQANSEQAFNETVGRVFSKVERYEQMKENKQNYKNVSSQDTWRQTKSQDAESFNLKTGMSQSKQGTDSLTKRSREENQSSRNKELQKVELRESLVSGASLKKADLVSTKQQGGQQMKGEENGSLTQNYNKYTDQDHINQSNIYPTTDKHVTMQKTGQIKEYVKAPKEYGKPSQKKIDTKLPENTPAPTNQIKDRHSDESKDEDVTIKHRKGQNCKAEETKTQRMAQVEQLMTQSVGFIPAEKTDFNNLRAEESKLDPTRSECLRQAKDEQKIEERSGELEEKFREKELEQDGGKQTRVQQLTDEPKNITEKDEHEHMREEIVKAEHAETEKLREGQIKTKPAKTEEAGMARTQQAKVEETNGKRINLEQVERKQLSTEQVVEDKMEAEQIKTENTEAEPAEGEYRKAEQIKETQTKTKHVNAAEIKAVEDHIKVEKVRQVKAEKDSSHVGKINIDKPTTLVEDTKLKETNAEQEKLEENKLDQSKATETEELTERSDKLTAAQPVRKEPDKVEQVKSELAKAKAELAKIKEKMRGEQKEKVKSNPTMKEDGTSKHHITIHTGEDKDGKKQEESGVLTHTEANDYERLREKYGYTNTTNRNQTTTQGSLTLHDANKTEVLPLKEFGAGNSEKSKHEPSLACSFIKANTEKKEEVSTATHSEVTFSEPSKELKVSNIDSVPTNLCNKANGVSFVDKFKDDSGHKLEKCDSVKNTLSQQRDSNLSKLNPPERKPESHEQNAGASLDLPVTSSRALSQKDRTQTKQEILTSKIKAHAEKEISAIKEKGLALREGFIGKGSAKHLGSGVNIRQKPPLQEVPKNHEALNNIPLKHQMEPSGVQKEPVKFAPVPSSATATVKSATTNSQLVERPAELMHSANSTISITESNMQKEVGVMSKVQSQEQATDISGRQKEELQRENSCEILSESKKDQTQATGVKAKLLTTEDETKESESQDGQKEAAVTEDSLQIVGIMVTIRERFPNVDTDQGNNSTGKQRSTAEKDGYKSEGEESHPRPGQGESTSSKEGSLIKAKDEMKSHSVVKEDPAKVKENDNPVNVQETLIMETKTRDMMENAAAKRTNQNSSANTEPRGETEPGPVTALAKGTFMTDTQTVPFKQNTKETKNIVTKSVKENLVQSKDEMTRDKETNQQQIQTVHINKKSTVINSEINNNAESSINEPLVKDLSEDSCKSRNIDGQRASLPEEKVLASTTPKPFNASLSKNSAENKKLPFNEEQSKEANQDVNVQIESIAIRVVSSATQEENTSDEHRLKSFPSASSEEKIEESLEGKLAVQHVLSSVRKLSDSLKASSKQNSANAHSESHKSEPGKPESNVLPVDGDYFQVQGVTETNNRSHINLPTEDKLKEIEHPSLLPNETSNELNKERKNEAFVFSLDQRERKRPDEGIKKTNQETEDPLSSTQTDGSMERQIITEKREAGQFNHIKKHQKENQLDLSAMESSRASRFKTLNPVPEKSEPKPKPKGRISAIPEISAIADYARLKVIVSEDKEETAPQEFPPNKKEGFFPLIKTRHSRRPVFNDEPPDLSVKDKKLPNKIEVTAKVNKEPKAIVFPITEKGHQRTGMFKLGDKQRPEQTVLDAKMNAGLKNNMETNSSIKETNPSPRAETGTKKLDPSTGQPNNRETAPSSASNRANNSSEELAYLDENLLLRANLGQMHHRKENKSHPEKQESPEKQKDKHTGTGAEDRRTEKVFRCEKTRGEEDTRIKHMLEESRASLAEEEREATRREEERRAKEREAVNIMIKERREKYRQSDARAGEEIEHKQREEQRVVLKEEERCTKQKVDPMTEKEGNRQIRIEDEKRAKLREEEDKKLKQHGKEKTAYVGQQRIIAKEEQRTAAQVQQQQRLVQEEQRRKSALEEQQRRTAQEEQQRRAAEEKKQEPRDRTRRAVHEEHQRRIAEEEQRTAAQVEQQRRLVQEEKRRKSSYEEQQRRAAQEDKQQRVAQEQQRKALHVEKQGRTAEEEQRRAAEMEQQWRKSAHEERRRRAAEEEQQQRAAQEEQQRKAVRETQQRRAAQVEQQRRAAEEEQHQRAAQKEQQRKVAQMEQQKRAAQEEQQQRAPQIEQQRRVAHMEKQKRAAEEDQHQRAAQIEQQRKATQKEHQQRAVQIEQHQRAAQIEQQRKAAQEEQQRKTVQEQQQQRAAQIEQQQRVAQEEQQRKTVQEEQQRRTAERQRRISQVEQQTKVAYEEKEINTAEKEQRRVAQIEQQRMLTQEEQLRKSHEEQQRKYVKGEKQSTVLQEAQQKRAEQEEQQREVEEHQEKAAQEKQQRRAAQVEEQKQAKQINDKIADDIQEEWKRKPIEDERTALLPGGKIIKHTQEQKTEELRKERRIKEQWIITQREDEEDNHEIMKQRQKQAQLEDAIPIEKKAEAQDLMLTKRENDMHDDQRKEDKRSAVHREEAKAIQTEKQSKEAHKLDALQYYAITSTNTETKPRERQPSSPVPSQLTQNQLVIESSDDSAFYTKPHRPQAAASPASSLPRSNASSPALGGKPLMFRVKDNTIRGSLLTKSIKPRFHKNFGEDLWVGSASDRTEDEQEIIRQSAGTPVHPDKGLNRLPAMSENSTLLPASSFQDYSTSISHQRPYSRRSMALDDDESRSVISSMSEDVESFATNATDVADVRSLFDNERPESACSFSSDASRSLGKPPVVPPKSEKALRRAQRLTSRRIKKELSKTAGGSPAGVEEKVSNFPSSTEVCSSSNHAVASPHFSPPITFAHAPSLGSSLPSSHTEHQPSHPSFHASPHATGPISLPLSSPHVSSTVSLPSMSIHASVPASKPAAHKTVAHVSSSSTPHLINPHSTPVTQYHVEPSHYHQSYPLTQHKVLQDLGSGQYFVVEVPVQVKTKTFFDPETGKYVQLNVRQSGQNISQPQPQQTYPQPQLQPQMQIKSQQQPLSQGSLTGKPFVFYPGYQGYPQSHQPVNSVHSNRSSASETHHQDQEPPRESHTSPDVQQNSEEHRYSPEKTPYMDTVNDANRTYNPINSTQDSYECTTNSQLVGSSICENSANSLYQPRDIITMSELEDFMEVSDW